MNFQHLNFQRLLRPLQTSVIASAALLLLPATAQTPPPASSASAATAAPEPPARAQRMQRKHYPGDGHRHHRYHRAGPRADGAEPANANRLADDGPRSLTEYERNALARCDAFKTRPDHRACVERLQQPVQGSVSGGGLLREYSYEVPAEPIEPR